VSSTLLHWAPSTRRRNNHGRVQQDLATTATTCDNAPNEVCTHRTETGFMAYDIQESGGLRVVSAAITVRRSQHDVYAEWRNFTELPRFMQHVQSVTESGETLHWVINVPGGSVAWDAVITADITDQVIRWQTIGSADVEHRGEIRFEPSRQGHGTEIYVTISYRPPAGRLGIGVAKLVGQGPGRKIDIDLHRFKQWMEVGSVASTHGQPRGEAQHDEWEEEQEEVPSPATDDRAEGVPA